MVKLSPVKPWAFIAHKDGRLAGVAYADLPKRDFHRFFGDCSAIGCTIHPVNNQAEYDAVTAKLKPWGFAETMWLPEPPPIEEERK